MRRMLRPVAFSPEFVPALPHASHRCRRYVGVTLNLDPFSPAGLAWLRRMNAALRRLNAAPGASEVYRLGMGASVIMDASEAALSRFPMLIALTNLTVLGFLALNFRSLVVPLRSIVSIGITLVIVYGLAVCV